MRAMLFLIISMCATPICLVLLVGMLAAYKRRCNMHPEMFETVQKEG